MRAPCREFIDMGEKEKKRKEKERGTERHAEDPLENKASQNKLFKAKYSPIKHRVPVLKWSCMKHMIKI